MTSSPHMKRKTFIEASCINNIHTDKKRFQSAATIERL